MQPSRTEVDRYCTYLYTAFAFECVLHAALVAEDFLLDQPVSFQYEYDTRIKQWSMWYGQRQTAAASKAVRATPSHHSSDPLWARWLCVGSSRCGTAVSSCFPQIKTWIMILISSIIFEFEWNISTLVCGPIFEIERYTSIPVCAPLTYLLESHSAALTSSSTQHNHTATQCHTYNLTRGRIRFYGLAQMRYSCWRAYTVLCCTSSILKTHRKSVRGSYRSRTIL